MIYRFFASALAAGVLAAVLITGLQAVITTPMILQAETYESAAPATAHDHGSGEAQVHPDAAWMPEDGLERLLYTLLANCGAGIGFSLLLVVGLSFDAPSVGVGRGVLWGAAGFAVFALSPALGLPPGAPGMPVPDEQAAQIWWVFTVLFGVAGLAALVFGQSSVLKSLGAVLIILPHLWGAPPLAGGESLLPPELAARFTASSIVLNGVFWAAMGALSGWFFARLGKE